MSPLTPAKKAGRARLFGHGVNACFALCLGLAMGGPVFCQMLDPVRLEPSGQALDEARSRDRAARSAAHLSGLRESLGLDEHSSFRQRESHTDQSGQTHTHFQQLHQGVRVWGGDAITHMDIRGAQGPITNALIPGLSLCVAPSLDEGQALAIADAHLAAKGGYAYAPAIELVVYPMKELFPKEGRSNPSNAEDFEYRVEGVHLAYFVHTVLRNGLDGIRTTDYLIDAHTGEILDRWDALQTENVVATGKSQYSGTVKFNTRRLADGSYELRDLTRGLEDNGFGEKGGNFVSDMEHKGDTKTGSPKEKGRIYTHTGLNWGDGANYSGGSTTSANGQTAAVDAFYGIAKSWDFYNDCLGRKSFDGKDGLVYARVHYSEKYDNAFWETECACMGYGDGMLSKAMMPLDVVAHEFSHGVCEKNGLGGLIYKNESGGLNEAHSDAMCTFAAHYVYGAKGEGGAVPDSMGAGKPSDYAPWTIGSQLGKRPIRILWKPSRDGFSPDEWTPELKDKNVHDSCGPANRMTYFLAQGAAAKGESSAKLLPKGMAGIGNDQTTRIWHRALTTYFTPAMVYVDARNAFIKAAQDLYGAGSYQEAAVWNAFAGVNVGQAWSGSAKNPNPIPEPIPGPKVTLTPRKAAVKKGESFQFNVKIENTEEKLLKWSADKGFASSKGLYHAPYQAGTFKLRVQLWSDAEAFDEAVITVK